MIFICRGVEQWLARWAHNPKAVGSNPTPANFLSGGIAQLVEQRDHNPFVAGSSPATVIIFEVFFLFISLSCMFFRLPFQFEDYFQYSIVEKEEILR